jgi:HK97 family phage prohead protease
MASSVMTHRENDFQIIKSQDDLMIGGYASIEIVDKQNDLITLKALQDAVKQFMEKNKFRNVMTNHSNVQVGEVVKSYRDKKGKLWKTEVDDVGFFVVIKLREDIEKAKEINRGIRKGTLRSFSIGGQALQKVKKQHSELGEYSEISKLELHEVTICEKGINPEAKFDILKQEKQKKGEKMTDKLEKALEELDTLLEEVNTLRKEDAPVEEEEFMNDAPPTEELEEMEYSEEDPDGEMKAQPDLGAGVLETGEPTDRVVIDNGKPTHDGQASRTVVKAFNNGEITSLNLAPENIEKAYVEYREEQLEKIAFSNITKTFEGRFSKEITNREAVIAKESYDAEGEVSALKDELTELRKSFSEDKTTILKSQENSMALPEGFPTSMDEISKMSWADLNSFAGN